MSARRGPAIAAVLLALFLIVGALVVRGGILSGDRAVLAALRVAGQPGTADVPAVLVTAAQALTRLGAGNVRAPLAIVGAIALLAARRVRPAAALLAGWAGEGLLVEGIKAAVARPRPELAWRLARAGETSFPSGHAAGAMLLYPLLGLFLGGLLGRRAGLRGAAVGVAVALLVGTTRVLLGVHWASDVLGGWLLGGAIAVIAAQARRSAPSLPRRDWNRDRPVGE